MTLRDPPAANGAQPPTTSTAGRQRGARRRSRTSRSPRGRSPRAASGVGDPLGRNRKARSRRCDRVERRARAAVVVRASSPGGPRSGRRSRARGRRPCRRRWHRRWRTRRTTRRADRRAAPGSRRTSRCRGADFATGDVRAGVAVVPALRGGGAAFGRQRPDATQTEVCGNGADLRLVLGVERIVAEAVRRHQSGIVVVDGEQVARRQIAGLDPLPVGHPLGSDDRALCRGTARPRRR